jgi:hypothetical protein
LLFIIQKIRPREYRRGACASISNRHNVGSKISLLLRVKFF